MAIFANLANYQLAPEFQAALIIIQARIHWRRFSTMPIVRVKENEPFEIALRRFKRSCEKAGVLTETRRREYYEKPTTERKRKAAAAVKRHQKKVSKEVSRRVRMY